MELNKTQDSQSIIIFGAYTLSWIHYKDLHVGLCYIIFYVNGNVHGILLQSCSNRNIHWLPQCYMFYIFLYFFEFKGWKFDSMLNVFVIANMICFT